ncbi:efflux RND transporter permease subunit [Marinobacter sp. SS21]|uniref:efflux RND transporter permease subunit n=1 Tax=Marinobacter sp. SS21 TaxID=2979460 RepID=UPI00232F4082|nr:MMPL family transporter [Marinobacter sp. SS21]MDC0662695.1 MMPL family transporter [Marinobacter sp. SS21]
MSNLNENLQFSALTRGVFRFRLPVLLLSLLATLYLGWQASFVQPDTRLERLIPGGHEFVANGRDFLGTESVGDSSIVRVAVAREQGTVFDYDYLVKLQKISDDLSLLQGVDTSSVNSLWSPGMLWFAITPLGYDSGPVIDVATFEDSTESMDIIRTNAFRAGLVGSYVSNDFKASMIDFQVLPINPATGQPLDFNAFSERLERVRQKYQGDDISIHVIGDVKKVADLVNGFTQVAVFFLIAFLITAALLFHYSRCFKSTLVPLFCSVVAVVWQLGAINLLGYGLGVFSVLVPFLVFAIAVSHGVQVINAIAHETAKGETHFNAARMTFHHLHKAGLVALVSDGIGFATLFMIDIGAIKDLAMAASVGVALVIITNLVLLPVLMSYVGVSRRCVEHAQHKLETRSALWEGLAHFAQPKMARIAVISAVVLAGLGVWYSQGLKIGDLDKGAPELRADSRYNQDNNFITSHFSTSTDLMTVFAGMPEGKCETYKAIDLIDRLGWQLTNTMGVQSVSSPATRAKMNRYLGNEGNLKMMALPRDERVLSRAIAVSGFSFTGASAGCDHQQLQLELTDHSQETLQRVVGVVRDFSAKHDDFDIWFRLGTGNAAYEAATNEVIERAQLEILAYVYGIVGLMVLLTFRSIKAVICILLPLALTSLLCQALMAVLGIGVKVATLPVIALGVGIGVDYGIYIYTRLNSYLALGHPLRVAYQETLKTTGKAVSFTGMTLAIGVATWIVSPIKFQADMGILLTFMFLWNMIGALTLLPALTHFLSRGNGQKDKVGEAPKPSQRSREELVDAAT